MPAFDNIPRGNLYVTVKVILPSKVSKEQRSMFSKSAWKDEL